MDWRATEIRELEQENGELKRQVAELEDAMADEATAGEAARLANAEAARIRQHEAEERLSNLETLCQLARQNYEHEHNQRVRAESTLARMVHAAEMQAEASPAGEAVLRFVRAFVGDDAQPETAGGAMDRGGALMGHIANAKHDTSSVAR